MSLLRFLTGLQYEPWPDERWMRRMRGMVRQWGVNASVIFRWPGWLRAVGALVLASTRTMDASPQDSGVVPLGSTSQWSQGTNMVEGVRIRGTLTFFRPKKCLFLADGTNVLYVVTSYQGRLRIGEVVEVEGTMVPGPLAPLLRGVAMRAVGEGVLPEPLRVDPMVSFGGRYDGHLIRLEGTVLSAWSDTDEATLLLQDRGVVFPAVLDLESGGRILESHRPGTRVAVTGVCSEHTLKAGVPTAFRVLLRRTRDVEVLSPPPWWTTRLASGMALLTAVLATVFWGVASARASACRRAELAHRDSETQLLLALEAGHTGTWSLDPHSGVVNWSSGQETLWGGPAALCIRTYNELLDHVSEGDRGRLGEAVRHISASGTSFSLEVRLANAGSGERWISICGRAFGADRDRRIMGTITNISERKLAEGSLRHYARQQATIAQLSRLAISSGPSELLPRALKMVCRLLSVEIGGIFEHDSRASVAKLVAGRGWNTGIVGLANLEAGANSLLTRCLESVDPLLLRRGVEGSGGDWPPLFREEGILSGVSVAIRSSNGGWGILVAMARSERRFLSDEVLLLRAVAGVLGEAVQCYQSENLVRRLSMAISQSADSVFITNRHGRIEYVNETFERMTGYVAAEVLGNTPRVVNSGFHPRSFFEGMWRSLQEGKAFRGEFRNRRKTGEVFCEEKTVSPVRDAQGEITHFVSVGRDITQRKQYQEALAASEERFRQIAENIKEVFWISDPIGGKLVYVSPAYKTIWGRSCETLYSEPDSWFEAVHPEDRDRVSQSVKGSRKGEPYDVAYRILKPDGTVRWIHDRAFPLRDAGGTVYRVAGIAQDVTEHRQLEEQLRQSQKMDAIGQLAGGVAHDFNNLLTVICGNASMLRSEGRLDPAATEWAAEILDAADRAASVTRQLLAFSRKQVMRMTRLDLNQIVARMAKLLDRLMGEQIRLQLSLASTLRPVCADSTMLEQVLVNLAVNARDAMPHGGELRISTAEEFLQGAVSPFEPEQFNGLFVRLGVRDTGCGIAADLLPRIFEPFFTTKEVGKGTGLGLATVFGIVKQHGGTIRVTSVLGAGTSFDVYLPVAGGGGIEPMPSPPLRDRIQGRGTVLLVEDDAPVRTTAQRILEQAGFRVLPAGSAFEALEVYDSYGERIDLLLTDIGLPGGINGHELAELLRERQPGIRSVFSTGYDPDCVTRGLPLGPGQAFLPKPWSGQDLLSIVSRGVGVGGSGGLDG